VDDVAWGVLTLGLTLLGGIYTWFAFKRRGLAAGLRGAGLTLLPLAAYLTKTLQMFSRIADAITDWAADLVFSPRVWLGVVVAGAAVVLYVAGRALDRRKGSRGGKPKQVKGETPRAVGGTTTDDDDDMADIEAILRSRGIT
jgi:hypothetical protein